MATTDRLGGQLDNEHRMRMAGRFSRHVRAYAQAHAIRVKDCAPGEKKHKTGEQHLRASSI
jgi:hypothetical protein